MIENVPAYVSITFIITTFLTIGFLFHAIKTVGKDSVPARLIVASIAFWLFFTAILSMGGFYLITGGFPPRFFLLPLPSLALIILVLVLWRKTFVAKLPIKTLTILHVVRIPVELVLWWLYHSGQVPQVMTFEGRNFDILAGLTAPVVAWIAFRGDRVNRPLLITWNVAGLLLLVNIIATAVLSLPSSFQIFGLDQPNVAVLQFPYVWLPAIVAPIVLFSHLASLNNLFKKV